MSKGNAEFTELSKSQYKAQAIWFLNGLKDDVTKEGNKVWDFAQRFIAVDDKGADGNELDEHESHKFLEFFNKTMTAMEMREALRTIDQDANGHMSLLEFLTYNYKMSVQDVVDMPQGDNSAELDAAQKLLDEVGTAIAEVQAKKEAQHKKLEESKAATAVAEAAYAKVKAAEDEMRALEDEQKAAVAALEAEQQAYHDKIAKLESAVNDPRASVVSKSKASNELSQAKQEDPLPLRKAKITQEASLRKVAKQRAACEAATAEAEAKKAEAVAAEKALEASVKELEQSETDLQAKLGEAQAAYEEAKKKSGGGLGVLYWMEREMFEADKSLPARKQRYDHKADFQFKPPQ
mmetsp:Transcript_56721/g.139461  ORF Transcript_56721/g.139461 Transcript_56721/m.139461 type:complete len:350 (-) Transcript_56721:1145-2194(-)